MLGKKVGIEISKKNPKQELSKQPLIKDSQYQMATNPMNYSNNFDTANINIYNGNK
jgi:hypothetical protein